MGDSFTLGRGIADYRDRYTNVLSDRLGESYLVANVARDGFRYNLADACGSLSVSPRPTNEALDDVYANSKASAYRVEHYSRATIEARRTHLTRVNAGWMEQMIDETGNPKARTFVDIGSNSPAIFDELYSLNPVWSVNQALSLRVGRRE